MRPIPVAFHIWFLEVHTYGIGLALTFWFGLRYTERRLRSRGYPWRVGHRMFVWVIVSAIVGARAMHVLSHLSYYTAHPAQVFAIWQGGLSSFGGLILAVPVAIVISAAALSRSCPRMRFADLMAPVLMACWGMGRLLGPQLMVVGGGHPTHQWFGMYYAGRAGPDGVARPDLPGDRRTSPSSASSSSSSGGCGHSAPATASDGSALRPSTRHCPRPASSSASGWSSGESSGSSTSTCGSGEDGHLGSLLVQIAGDRAGRGRDWSCWPSRVGPFRRWRDSRPDPVPPPGTVTDATVPAGDVGGSRVRGRRPARPRPPGRTEAPGDQPAAD